MMLILALSKEEAAAAVLGFRDGLRLHASTGIGEAAAFAAVALEASDTPHAVSLAHELDAALRARAASWRGWRIEYPCPICNGTKLVPVFYARCMGPGYNTHWDTCRSCT
jgi:hypothetical protein